ncbi:MAG: hypothetical protein GQ525_00430 [Draconibacterium sp.]|nr:hypothetical protein [Draconibacterium sp.]
MRTNINKQIRVLLIAVFAIASVQSLANQPESGNKKYSDGRPATSLRMDAKDHGIVLWYGDGPQQCDILGARMKKEF